MSRVRWIQWGITLHVGLLETTFSSLIADYFLDFSGEFSYWNFSMRLKQHIEQMGGLESWVYFTHSIKMSKKEYVV